MQDFEQPFRRTRGRRHLAPDFAELAEAGRGERRIQHELAEPARRDRADQHVVRADPQDQHHAGEHDEDDDRGQHRARLGRIARGLIGLLDLAAEPRIGQSLVGIGLHGADGADQFGGIGGRLRQRVLRVARQPAHPAPERHQRNHDQRNRQQHKTRQPRAGDHHHRGGADEQHHVAQRDRYRGADRRFDLRGVGGEPRDQFAAARRIEERRRQRDQMREHVAPQIGDDALADGHHQIEPRRTGACQHRDHRDHHGKVAVDHGDAFGREPEVDHAAHRDRHDQRGQRRDGQRDEGEKGAAAVARHIGRQRQQRTQFGAAGGRRLRQLRFDRGRLGQRFSGSLAALARASSSCSAALIFLDHPIYKASR